jgi:hypothetical protein
MAVAALHAPPQLILPSSSGSLADPPFIEPMNLGEKSEPDSDTMFELIEDGPLLAADDADPHNAGDEGEAIVEETDPPECVRPWRRYD